MAQPHHWVWMQIACLQALASQLGIALLFDASLWAALDDPAQAARHRRKASRTGPS